MHRLWGGNDKTSFEDYIEILYSPKGQHGATNLLSLTKFEKQHLQQLKVSKKVDSKSPLNSWLKSTNRDQHVKGCWHKYCT